MIDILMVNLPFKDHVQPTLGLVKALVERGYNVTYILTKEWQGKLEALGASFVPYDQFPKRPTNLDLTLSSYKAAYRTALRIGKKHDMIIYETLFYLGNYLGEILDRPVIRLCAGSLLSSAGIWQRFKSHRFVGLLDNQLAERLFTKITARGTGFKGIAAEEFKSDAPIANFVYSTKEFQIEEGKRLAGDYHYVGPSLYKRTGKVHTLFPGSDKALIFIHLDNADKDSFRIYRMCIESLWDIPVQVILLIDDIDHAKRLGEIPNNVCIYDNISVVDILPRADVIITSGGLDIVSQAIHYNVPIISVPKTLEQCDIADRIEELGIGVRIKKNTSVVRLKKAIIDVVSDPLYLSNLMYMSKESRTLGGDMKAVMIIEKILNNYASYFFNNSTC